MALRKEEEQGEEEEWGNLLGIQPGRVYLPMCVGGLDSREASTAH